MRWPITERSVLYLDFANVAIGYTGVIRGMAPMRPSGR